MKNLFQEKKNKIRFYVFIKMLILIFILSGCTENSFVNFMESENGIIDEISEGNSDSWMKLEAENIVSQDKAILIANNHFLSMNEVSSQKKTCI